MTSDARAMGRNLSLISINKAVQLAGAALWAAIIPRWLGPTEYGQFSLAMTTSMLLWWAGDFGGLEVFGRHIPILSERNPGAARELFGQAFLLRLLVGLSLAPIMLVIGPYLAPYLTGWVAVFVGLAAGIHIVSWTSFHLLYAQREMGKWAIELSWRLFTQLPLVLLVGKYGLTAQMAAFTVNEVIYCALVIWWTRGWFSWSSLKPRLGFLRPYLRMGMGFWATNVGLILLFRMGTLFVQVLTGNPAEVSYFDLALTAFILVYTIIDQLVRAFLPTMTGFHEGGQSERVGQWLQMVTQWGAAIAVLAVIAVQYTADWVLPFIVGREYIEAANALQIMLLSLPALALAGIGTVASAVRQSPRAKLIAIGAGIVVSWGSSLWLIPRSEAIGAAWALTLGLNVYALILFAQVRADLRLHWAALIGIIGLGVPFVFLRPLLPDSFLIAVLATALASVLYLGAGLLLRLLSPAPLALIPRLLHRGKGAGSS